MNRLWPSFFFVILFSACSVQPVPIEYGADKCDFCRMTIVDQQHAAELVTTKGKVFKFDAIECMIQYAEGEKETAFAFQMVNDFMRPGELVVAETCHFLISRRLPSPMGANLTAFTNQTDAAQMQQERGGQVFDWEEVRLHLQKQFVQ